MLNNASRPSTLRTRSCAPSARSVGRIDIWRNTQEMTAILCPEILTLRPKLQTRRKNLEDAIKLFRFLRECDSFETWMDDKVSLPLEASLALLRFHDALMVSLKSLLMMWAFAFCRNKCCQHKKVCRKTWMQCAGNLR